MKFVDLFTRNICGVMIIAGIGIFFFTLEIRIMETFILFFLFFFLQSQKANKYRTFKNRFINLF